jgi:SP family general alpha glucoside:H+ symporter-like MFS transporter
LQASFFFGYILLISTMDVSKSHAENIENVSSDQGDGMPTKSMGPIMRSREEDIGVWQCARRFKTVSLIAMTAAFSASLDGYRKPLPL